ncbi:hypothetical protein OG215_36040 (plasmid) [Streptomyces globisporus]|uniref:hypothetical protein n=1 Tax=Streptomyces globisporus TaxID=1908 RepID=UPI002F914FF5|nr:hypothetical protein OG215_36040 [Streptomyces globisporus]
MNALTLTRRSAPQTREPAAGSTSAFTAAPVPGFDREQWTTFHASRLTVGDVFGTHRAAPHRPAVLTAMTATPAPGEWDRLSGTGQYLDTGEEFTFEYRANTTVTVRCDLRYTVDTAHPATG